MNGETPTYSTNSTACVTYFGRQHKNAGAKFSPRIVILVAVPLWVKGLTSRVQRVHGRPNCYCTSRRLYREHIGLLVRWVRRRSQIQRTSSRIYGNRASNENCSFPLAGQLALFRCHSMTSFHYMIRVPCSCWCRKFWHPTIWYGMLSWGLIWWESIAIAISQVSVWMAWVWAASRCVGVYAGVMREKCSVSTVRFRPCVQITHRNSLYPLNWTFVIHHHSSWNKFKPNSCRSLIALQIALNYCQGSLDNLVLVPHCSIARGS